MKLTRDYILTLYEEVKRNTKPRPKPEFIIVQVDPQGNTNKLPVLPDGVLGVMSNSSGIPESLSNIGYMLTPKIMREAGYESGTSGRIKYIRNAAKKAWELSKGDPQTFARKFGDLIYNSGWKVLED